MTPSYLQLVTSHSNALMEQVPNIIKLLEMCFKMACIQIRRVAIQVIRNLLKTLCVMDVMEHRCVLYDWETPFAEFLPIRHWGTLVNGR